MSSDKANFALSSVKNKLLEDWNKFFIAAYKSREDRTKPLIPNHGEGHSPSFIRGASIITRKFSSGYPNSDFLYILLGKKILVHQFHKVA